MRSTPSEMDTLIYPTGIAWPRGCDAVMVADALAETGLIDPASARFLLARKPPLILGCFDPERADCLVHAIRRIGGEAFAPSMADLVALGPTMKAREMRILEGILEVDLWNGPTATVQRDHVQILVRASNRSDAESDRTKRIADGARQDVEGRARLTQFNTAIRRAAQRNIDRWEAQDTPGVPRIIEKLDIHLVNGSIFQINADRFSFNVLGAMKGASKRESLERLCEMLSHIAPDEVFDTYFPLFRAPPHHQQLLRLVPGLRRDGESPAFAFYSRWTALLHRYVMRAPEA